MLQELMLSIVETYLARRASGARLWRGSPFADNRIRKALALLRAHPNKEVNMNALASQVGLSRSRFYDLFQISTGRSPRAYLDMLCVASAISKLSSGRGRIADVSAELGFSAQSNFTRFFQQQVGIPPSEYRRVAAKPNADPQEDPAAD
jgi:AraC-like DNA-binding protein